MVPLAGSARTPGKRATKVRSTSANTLIDVTVRVRPSNPLPTIPQSGDVQLMTHQEWEAKYGASPGDIEAIQKYAQDCGLKVAATSSAERRVLLSGKVSDFRQAFNVGLDDYEIDGRPFRGRSGAVYVPKSLKEVVTGVFGLSDEPFAQPRFRLTHAVDHSTALQAPGFTPTQIARRYNFPTNVDGTGQTIGIIELGGGFQQDDLNSYFGRIGVNRPKIVVFDFVGGGTNSPGNSANLRKNPDVEVMLDIEVAGAVAPGAKIVLYFAPSAEDQSFLDAMTAAVHDTRNNPSVISISWGGPEATATSQFQRSFDEVLQAAAHLGITVCVASGDCASADFPVDDPQWDQEAHVDFPASSPFSLACGGTRIIGGIASRQEVAWHSGPNEGTGGGVSRVFPLPSYQANAGVPKAKNPIGRVGRGVPDVAANAAQESGYMILCEKQFFPDLEHSPPLPPIGGTSAVAPLWAGLIALINQSLGRRVGFINPALYRFSMSAGAIIDITSGDNGDYQAGPGWDPCTGLGVPNGQSLIKLLAQPGTNLQHFEQLDSFLSDSTGNAGVALLKEYFQTTRALIRLLQPPTIASGLTPGFVAGGGQPEGGGGSQGGSPQNGASQPEGG